jgi:hypothetical protein
MLTFCKSSANDLAESLSSVIRPEINWITLQVP